MALSEIAATSQGPMVGDYISTCFCGGKATPCSRWDASSPTATSFDEAMYAPTTLLGVASEAFGTRLADHGDYCYLLGGRARQRGGGTRERIDMGAPLWGHGRAIGRPGAPFKGTPERHDHALHF
jgi:hypothetical protein